MVADNAITISCSEPDGTVQDRSFKGLRKLVPISKIQAGLSYWGWANFPPDDNISQDILVDRWIQNLLITKNDEFNSIDELAQLLERELRKVVPTLSSQELENTPLGTGGIHLVGYVEYEGKLRPSFWHIHNGLSQSLLEKKFPELNNQYNLLILYIILKTELFTIFFFNFSICHFSDCGI